MRRSRLRFNFWKPYPEKKLSNFKTQQPTHLTILKIARKLWLVLSLVLNKLDILKRDNKRACESPDSSKSSQMSMETIDNGGITYPLLNRATNGMVLMGRQVQKKCTLHCDDVHLFTFILTYHLGSDIIIICYHAVPALRT